MPSDFSQRDLVTQGMQLRAATVDEAARSVEAVLTTERVVTVFDWNNWETIDEVLLADGAEFSSQFPLLESHSRYSTDDLIGSVRDVRREGGTIVGRLFFVKDDEDAERVWNKVRQGHLTDVSIGYQNIESTRVEQGQKAIVGGREFAAGSRALRVVTKFRIRECSAVVIGADQAAKIRAEHLPSKERQHMPTTTEVAATPVTQPVAQSVTQPLPDGVRTEVTTLAPSGTQVQTAPTETVRTAEEAARQEAARQKAIRSIYALNPRAIGEDLLNQCLDDLNCTAERAGQLFQEQHRKQTAAPVGAAPETVVVNDDEKLKGLREIALAMALRSGASIEKLEAIGKSGIELRGGCYQRGESPLNGRSSDELRTLRQRAAAHSSWNQSELIRRALQIANVPVPDSRLEMVSRALSTAAVQDLFTTNVQAMMLIGYLEAPDSTTAGFVVEEDLDNYLTAEAVDLSKMGGMKKRTRGKPAEHADMTSNVETYSVASYSEQFEVDEMDLINDRFGAIQARAPMELGADAARLRPDLVYSMLLSNPTLATDNTAVFHNDHGNLLTTATYAMGKTALEAGLKAMAEQRMTRGKNKIPLNLRGRWVLVPTGLGHFTRELLGSTTLLISGDTDRTIGNLNALANDNLVVVEESRLNVTGCWNPATGAMVAGSATAWYLASDQRRSLVVAYLRGTGRRPRLRTTVHSSNGLYGMQWDVEHSIGTKFLGYRDWLKANGA